MRHGPSSSLGSWNCLLKSADLKCSEFSLNDFKRRCGRGRDIGIVTICSYFIIFRQEDKVVYIVCGAGELPQWIRALAALVGI